MLRRTFVVAGLCTLAVPAEARPRDSGAKLAKAAIAQLGITRGYDPNYTKISYPGGDVPRDTGVCADVIVRAARDGLGLDLQKLVHEDMLKDFSAYPKTWHLQRPDANIDHRRVPNLEVYWRRGGAQLWFANGPVSGNGFPEKLQVGDILTWRLDARLPHVGIVVDTGFFSTTVLHNIGAGVVENTLFSMRSQRAIGHYRWPVA
jgi:uncharacterized protein YijF (DUF1287 family)